MSWFGCSKAAQGRLLLDDRRGVTAIEFGFVAFILFVLLLGAVDLGRYHFTLQSLRDVAAEAARAALLQANQAAAAAAANNGPAPSPPSSLANEASVKSLTPFLDPGSLTFTVTSNTASGLTTIRVTANYQFQFVAPLLPSGTITLQDSAALSY